MKLGVPLSRSVIAASSDQDLDLWVRAEPDADGRQPDDRRVEGPAARAAAADAGRQRAAGRRRWKTPSGRSASPPMRSFGSDGSTMSWPNCSASRLSEAVGQPLTRHFLLADNGDGVMPLLTALAGARGFRRSERAVSAGKSDGPDHAQGHGAASRLMAASMAMKSELIGLERRPVRAPAMFDPALDEALRSPLDRIIAAAERIVDRSEGPLRSDYAAYAGDIAAAGRHLLSVIRIDDRPGSQQGSIRTGRSGRRPRRGNPTGSGHGGRAIRRRSNLLAATSR